MVRSDYQDVAHPEGLQTMVKEAAPRGGPHQARWCLRGDTLRLQMSAPPLRSRLGARARYAPVRSRSLAAKRQVPSVSRDLSVLQPWSPRRWVFTGTFATHPREPVTDGEPSLDREAVTELEGERPGVP